MVLNIPLGLNQISLFLECWLIDRLQILICDFEGKNLWPDLQANLVKELSVIFNFFLIII